MDTSRRAGFLVCVATFTLSVAVATAQPPVDAAGKPYVGTWSGKENPQLGLPAPRLKISKTGKGAYFLKDPDKPLYEFEWTVGDEDELRATVTDGERFFAAIIRPDGKLVWKQAKLPPGTKTNGIEFEKVPSDF